MGDAGFSSAIAQLQTMGPTLSDKPSNLLEPINLHDPAQFAELQRHRILCGWKHQDKYLLAWRAAVDAGTLAIFWILLPPNTDTMQPPADRRVGHIAMERITYAPESPSLPFAPPGGENDPVEAMDLNTFFILPEFRRLGLGRRAVAEMERLATVEPYGWRGCRAMTLNTFARKYVEEDELRAVAEGPYVAMGEGIEYPAKGTGNEDWYGRMGYATWKVVPTYHVPWPREKGGNERGEYVFDAAWMWKGLASELADICSSQPCLDYVPMVRA
ncbi:hypothetical protein QBC47DRAFT_370790 [Echria macrotheca]|uniref:N-acetyltransferase domain-containing protein n=1 Tax=Echria macrotheca TaxID=438768 RepID=A0AAJ0FEN1_9PEZI|nr:hypothetical protein QBC47DRAFT_370790 [Echria macrotheca]